MNKLKTYNQFIKESMETLEQLYDTSAELITQAAGLLGNEELINADPSEVIDALKADGSQKALWMVGLIEDIERMINEFPDEE